MFDSFWGLLYVIGKMVPAPEGWHDKTVNIDPPSCSKDEQQYTGITRKARRSTIRNTLPFTNSRFYMSEEIWYLHEPYGTLFLLVNTSRKRIVLIINPIHCFPAITCLKARLICLRYLRGREAKREEIGCSNTINDIASTKALIEKSFSFLWTFIMPPPLRAGILHPAPRANCRTSTDQAALYADLKSLWKFYGDTSLSRKMGLPLLQRRCRLWPGSN